MPPPSAILTSSALPKAGPFPTLDPFLFCVYHKDHYPNGNAKMEAPKWGNGQDFDPSLTYRMYHGERIPGFPQHPHRGFETVTATLAGWIDHADSLGNAGRYGEGDVQWMTAGKGICHSEMFPLINTTADNPLTLFQIWLNLPSQQKMVDPFFTMLWHNTIPRVTKTTTSDDGSNASHARVTLWSGDVNYYNFEADHAQQSLPTASPPPNSWAHDPEHDVVILHVAMEPGSRLVLPKAKNPRANRSLFYIEGDAGVVKVDGISVGSKIAMTLDPNLPVALVYESTAQSAQPVEFLMLQGQPIEEPVAQHGPFVMNTRSEIQQAFADYAKTQFGGWPWPRDDMVFPPSKGRFALVNGEETTAPSSEQEGTCSPKSATDK